MPMEIEYFDMDGEVVDVETTAADMVNGRGEEESQEESQEQEQAPTLGSNEHFETIGRGEDDQSDQSASEFATVSQGGDTPKIDPDYKPRVDWGARFEAEYAHEREIAEAKEAHTAASLARQAAEEVFKAAKATEKACLSELSALINRGPQYPDSKPINQGGESPIDAAVRGPSPTLDDSNADQSWRNIPIAPMLDGIKGMGEKKREAILSLTPTLGDFEDLRGKASQSHKQLYEVMPKGVGRAMADELEERALSAMRKHQLELERNKPEPEQSATDQPGDGEPDSELVESPS